MATPAFRTISRAADLLPIFSMASGEGPMKLMPQSRHTSAKWGFSARNPYPGWMASTPSSSAVLMMLGMLR